MSFICAILGGYKACDLVGAHGNCLKELFGHKKKMLFEALLGDGSPLAIFWLM